MNPVDAEPDDLVRSLGVADAALPPAAGAGVTLAQLRRRQKRRFAIQALALTLLVSLLGSALARWRSPAAAADLAAVRAEVRALRSLLTTTHAEFAAAAETTAHRQVRLGVLRARAIAALGATDRSKETRR